MAYYRSIGSTPPKRHTQHRTPEGGLYWTSAAAHPSLPRSEITGLAGSGRTLEQVLFGPTESPYGSTNLFGALRRAMAKTGYSDLKEFQRVGLTIRG